mmetsp:Transcript_10953/g.23474  ORF Transcript_10953/g.23474 Transcript_10953/m.23474 type:complete len:309 (+) Transcript_10953:77-1003(+)
MTLVASVKSTLEVEAGASKICEVSQTALDCHAMHRLGQELLLEAAEVYDDALTDAQEELPLGDGEVVEEEMERWRKVCTLLRFIYTGLSSHAQLRGRSLGDAAIHCAVQLLERLVVTRPELGAMEAAACLLISAKMDCIAASVPLTGVVAALQNMFGLVTTPELLLEAEVSILNDLSWRVNEPTSVMFLHRILQVAEVSPVESSISCSLLGWSLLIPRFREGYYPSELANAAVYLAKQACGAADCWPLEIEHYTRVCEGAVQGCAEDMRLGLTQAAVLEQLNFWGWTWSHGEPQEVAMVVQQFLTTGR